MKITLCGSTRFNDEFAVWNARLTLAGHVVYSLAIVSKQEGDLGKEHISQTISEDDKNRLDLVHLAKIEESDAIVVLNRDDYIGQSTTRELMWARMRGKKVYWLEDSKHHIWGERCIKGNEGLTTERV